MTKTIRELFEAKFTKTDGCWNWTAHKDRDGYGTFWFDGRQKKAHRMAWMLYVGEIPDGLYICHHCDNAACVNPSHLFLGTAADNAHDCISKGRKVALPDNNGEKSGKAKLTDEQVLTIRARYATGVKQGILASEFNVARPHISAIINRRHWTKLIDV